jgi:hypothetical protein
VGAVHRRAVVNDVIESPELAERVRDCLERELAPRNAWRVEQTEDDGLRWTTQGLQQTVEPEMGAGEHARMWFLQLLHLRGEI